MVRQCLAFAHGFGDLVARVVEPAFVSCTIDSVRVPLRRVSPSGAGMIRVLPANDASVTALPTPHPVVTPARLAHDETNRPHGGTGFGNCVEDM